MPTVVSDGSGFDDENSPKHAVPAANTPASPSSITMVFIMEHLLHDR